MIDEDWPYLFFNREELQCRCGCEGLPKHEFVLVLDSIREEVGFPMHVSSGYRCPSYNRVISYTGETGPHTTGLAVDVLIFGYKAHRLLNVALKKGVTGIGLRQHGVRSSRYMHLDMISPDDDYHPRPWIWTY